MRKIISGVLLMTVLMLVGCSHSNPLEALTPQQFHAVVMAINSATQNDMTCGNRFAGRVSLRTDTALNARCQTYAKAGVLWLKIHKHLSVTQTQFTAKALWQRYLTWLYRQQQRLPQ